jgi:Tfp pilus assembly protein PilW
MPDHRPRRLIQGQGGSTLIELLVAMPFAVLLLGIVIQALATTYKRQGEIERRTQTVQQAQIGLERMTRELRQADWVYFSSSSVVDLDAEVRTAVGGSAVHRHVRYDCSGTDCVRYEGPAVAFPPAANSTFDFSRVVIGPEPGDTLSQFGTVAGHDVFFPQRVLSPSGQTVADFVDPDVLLVRLQLHVSGNKGTVQVQDGVSLRNRSDFA